LSKKLENSLILNINVSRFLTASLLLVHLGGMALIGVIPLAMIFRLGLWALLAWSLYRSLQTHAWRKGSMAILALELDGDGVAAVRFEGGETWHQARITSRFVHSWLTLLSLHIESRRWPVKLVIVADAVEPESFRRWRARLKLLTAAE
jgi:Membrane-bound toxin component of toxin-antitoxin system